jgi:hypothetical protein
MLTDLTPGLFGSRPSPEKEFVKSFFLWLGQIASRSLFILVRSTSASELIMTFSSIGWNLILILLLLPCEWKVQ